MMKYGIAALSLFPGIKMIQSLLRHSLFLVRYSIFAFKFSSAPTVIRHYVIGIVSVLRFEICYLGFISYHSGSERIINPSRVMYST